MVYCLIVSTLQGARVLWQKEYEIGGELSYSPGAVTFDKIDNKLLIIGTSFFPKGYSEDKIRFWEIDLNGNMTKDEILGDVPEKFKTEAHTASRFIKGLSISNSRRIKAMGNFGGLGISLIDMNRQGTDRTVKSVEEIGVAYDDNLILKTVDLPNNSYLFIGKNKHDDGLAIKIDSSGNKLWEQTYDKGQVEYLSDGVAIGNNGDFVIVGGSVKPDGPMSVGKDSSIWLLKCDPQGNVVSEKVFLGDPFVRKMPQICQLSTGEIIVAYNKIQTDSLAFKALSFNFEEFWDNQASVDEISVYDFKIKPVSEKGFIVVLGFSSTGLGVYEYNKDGNITSKFSWEKVVRGGNFLLETSGDKAFVILQTRAQDEKRINNLKVIAFQID